MDLILACRGCGATHLITPPKRKMKKTVEIELNCYRCDHKSNYAYTYKLKRFRK